MTFTAKEMREAAERESRMRRRVYPKWVEGGKMTARQAARETELMDAIAEHFRKLEEGERLL